MPAAVPLVAAVAGSAVAGSSFFAGATLLGAVAGTAVAGAINTLGSRALMKKPKKDAFIQEAGGRVFQSRASIDSHKIVYGRTRVSGTVVFEATTSSGPDSTGETISGDNIFYHVVLALAAHECDAVEEVYLNDQAVQGGPGGWISSAPFTRQVEREVVRRANLTNIAFAKQANATGYVVTVTTAADHGFSAGQQITIEGAGPGGSNGPRVIGVVPSATTFQFIIAGNDPSKPGGPGSYATGGTATRRQLGTATLSYARVKVLLGGPDQQPDPDLVAEVPAWASAHRPGHGITYIYCRFQYSADSFPLGIPQVSAIVRGKKVYDPRTDATAWSENAALCQHDYLTSRDQAGFPYGYGLAASRIHLPSLIASANICDEDVLRGSGITQKRYTCNGVIDTASVRRDNLDQLCTATAGSVVEVQDQYRILAAAYSSPVGEITADMLAGRIEFTTRTPKRDLFNAVRGVFVDPERGYQPTDFPFVGNDFYESQDGGERIMTDLQLPFTNDWEAAQRIAKIVLEKVRQGIVVTVPLKHHALRFSVEDVVGLTFPQFGWANKPFRIKEWGWPDAPTGPVMVTLQEESAASYDWDPGQAQTVDPVPDTNLPKPWEVKPPGALSVEESKYFTRANAVKAGVTLSWVASEDAFLSGYQPEYKLRSEGTWRQQPRTDATEAFIEDIEPGEYDFRVKAINTLRVSSAYSTASMQISGLLDAPLEPQNLTIATIGGFAYLYFDQSPDLDVRSGGQIVFRHSPDEGALWHQTVSIGRPAPGAVASWQLPLKPGVYMAKAVDSSGVESLNWAQVVTTQATALAYANVTSLVESPAFSGTKTGCFVASGVLKLSGAGLFDSISDFDSVPDLDAYGGTAMEATYDFSGAMDLGTVSRIRLTGSIEASVFHLYDLIDSRATPIDDWLDFDGGDAAAGDAVIYVRQTDDIPGGSPTWGPWRRLDSGEFVARAFQFQLVMTVRDPTYQMIVSQLSVDADEVA